MFNKEEKHYHEHTIAAVTRVVEKTISPDKMTEIYSEVKKEVEKSIIGVYKIKGVNIEAIGAIMKYDANTIQKKYLIRYNLNGEERYVEGIFPENISAINYNQELYTALIEDLKSNVGARLLTELVKIIRF